jgi:hypothetical protein
MRRVAPTAVLLLAVGLSPVRAAPAADPLSVLEVEPSRVPVSLFFRGATLHVSARIPEGSEAVVRLASDAERLELKEKGRVGGMLWMSVGNVVFEAAPVLYQLLTTAPLETLAPPAVLNEWRLGYPAVIVPADDEGARFIPELVALKERDGLYMEYENGLRVSPDGGGLRVDGQFVLPASVRSGDYSVVLVGFSGGDARELGRASIVVQRVGAVRFMRGLAMDHGLLYGFGAVTVALVTGLLTGLLFRSRRHGAH